MSEPDSRPGRRPPTIDLKATEIGEPQPAAGGADAPPPPSPGEAQSPSEAGATGGKKTHVLSGIVGALAMAAVGAGLWYFGFLPANDANAPTPATPSSAVSSTGEPPAPAAPAASPAPGQDAALAARLDKIEAAIHAQRPPATDPALVNGLAAAQAQTKSLGEQLAALNRRVDDIAGTSQTAAKQAEAAQTAAQSAKSASQSVGQTAAQKSDVESALGPLAERIAALERSVAALSENAAHPATTANDPAARLIAASEVLRSAVDSGAPYQAELDTVTALGADRKDTQPLEDFAATGVPSSAALGHELTTLIPALEHATDKTEDDTTFVGRLEANARRLVRIAPAEAPRGSDPASVVARLKIDAAHANIAAALKDAAALPDSAKPIAADWVARAEARAQAIAASRRIADAALAALSKPGTQ